jgi:hypothetical protein
MSQRSELVDIVLSFLEILFHGVLYYRGVYPPALFERHRAYGMAVWRSRHPQLNTAIHEVLFALKPPLLKGVVEAVSLVILDERGRALEQYTTDLNFSAPDVAATYSDLDTMLAAAVTKLAMLDVNLPRLGRECSFTVLTRAHEVLVGPHTPSAAEADTSSRRRAAIDGASGGPSLLLRPGGPWIRVDAGDPEGALDSTAAHGGHRIMMGQTSGVHASAPLVRALAVPDSSGSSDSAEAPAAVEVIKTIHAGPLFLRLSVSSTVATSS